MADLPTGSKQTGPTVLSSEEEAVAVAFRRHTLLPLDDCQYALQVTITRLTRSSLHRCFNATASPGCRMWTATGLPARSSRPMRSATSISISLRLAPSSAAYNFARRLKNSKG